MIPAVVFGSFIVFRTKFWELEVCGSPEKFKFFLQVFYEQTFLFGNKPLI